MGPWARAAAAVVLVLVGAVLATVLVRTADAGTPGRLTASCRDDEGDADRVQGTIDSSEEGDEVVLDGPCLIDSTIVLRGGRAYRGESPTTTLRAAPGSNLRAVLASDSWEDNRQTTGDPISLRDLTVDAARDDNPRAGDGVVIRSWHSQIEDLRILDARGSCLRVTGRSRDGTDLPAESTQVNGTLSSIFAYHCGTHGIYVEDKGNSVTDWNLTDSWVGDTGDDGIRMENAAGWAVRGNHLFDVGGDGIDALRLFATSMTDNYVEDFGADFGIAAYAQGSAGSVISGNRVTQNKDDAGGVLIEVVGASEGTSVVTVTGNVLVGNGQGTGLRYRSDGATLSVTSQGNSVSAVSTPLTGVEPNAGY